MEPENHAKLATVVWMAIRQGVIAHAEGPKRLALTARLGIHSVPSRTLQQGALVRAVSSGVALSTTPSLSSLQSVCGSPWPPSTVKYSRRFQTSRRVPARYTSTARVRLKRPLVSVCSDDVSGRWPVSGSPVGTSVMVSSSRDGRPAGNGGRSPQGGPREPRPVPHVSTLIFDPPPRGRSRHSNRPGPLGHANVGTTMIYTHVLNRGVLRVRSPVDRL